MNYVAFGGLFFFFFFLAPWKFNQVFAYTKFHSFSLLSDIPQYGHATVCLTIHPH